MKTVLMVMALSAGLGLAWYGQKAEASTSRLPILIPTSNAYAAPAANVVDQAGNRPQFEIELVPDAVLLKGGSETLEYHANLISRFDEPAQFAWTATIVDDGGTIVRQLSTGDGTVGKNTVAMTPAIVAELPDGYYTLKVRAALHSDHSEDVSEGVQFLRVKGAKMREMSATDWYRVSNATQAVRVTNGGAP